jgi:hypothetical protein
MRIVELTAFRASKTWRRAASWDGRREGGGALGAQDPGQFGFVTLAP